MLCLLEPSFVLHCPLLYELEVAKVVYSPMEVAGEAKTNFVVPAVHKVRVNDPAVLVAGVEPFSFAKLLWPNTFYTVPVPNFVGC